MIGFIMGCFIGGLTIFFWDREQTNRHIKLLRWLSTELRHDQPSLSNTIDNRLDSFGKSELKEEY